MPVTSAAGATSGQLLLNLASFGREAVPMVTSQLNIRPVFDVHADVQGRDLYSASLDIDKVLKAHRPDAAKALAVTLSGQVETMRESYTGLFTGIALAIILVYLFLVMNFQSWMDPLIVLMAVPFALGGVLWMLFLSQTPMSVPALMGTLMCIGLTTANSILVVSFANQRMAAGDDALLAATSALNTAHSQLNLAQTNEKRKHGLYDAKAGSLQDWLQSQADLVAAENSLRAAETALGLVRNRLRILGKSDAEIGALENAKTMDPVAFVVAPISGTVIDRQVGLGQYVQSNASTPVYSIGDLSTVWLIANVREVDAPRMRLGAPVEVHVLALPERVFKAKLTYVARSVDPNTHRLPVRAEIPNRDGVLKAEMFASFSINTGGESAAPAVPEGALVYEGETARVWVAQDDGTLTSRPIRAGRVSNGMVEIVAGLVPGEKVVTSGSLFIDRAAKGD